MEKFITTLMIHYAENSFISPLLWKNLGKKGQEILSRELLISNLLGNHIFPECFEMVNLNFFDPKFDLKRMKTTANNV